MGGNEGAGVALPPWDVIFGAMPSGGSGVSAPPSRLGEVVPIEDHDVALVPHHLIDGAFQHPSHVGSIVLDGGAGVNVHGNRVTPAHPDIEPGDEVVPLVRKRI